jgi:hypothetical protein
MSSTWSPLRFKMLIAQGAAEAGADMRAQSLALVNLPPLMERTSGRPEIVVGLIDGPVATGLSSLASENIRQAAGSSGSCPALGGPACQHGTYLAGTLNARRSSPTAGICPGCTLLVRSIFLDTSGEDGELPRATPDELAAALSMHHHTQVHAPPA